MFKGSTFKVGAKRVPSVPKFQLFQSSRSTRATKNQETSKTLAEFPHRPGDEQERTNPMESSGAVQTAAELSQFLVSGFNFRVPFQPRNKFVQSCSEGTKVR